MYGSIGELISVVDADAGFESDLGYDVVALEAQRELQVR